MNILFYIDNRVTPHSGGTERATLSVARCLRDVYGHECYCLYSYSVGQAAEDVFPGEAMQMPLTGRVGFLRRHITERCIGTVIVQGNFRMACDVRRALPSGYDCRIIMAHHYAPAWEVQNCTLSTYRQVLHYSASLKHRLWYTMKCLFFPLFRQIDIHRLRSLYRQAYECADLVVLLSETYREGFMRFGRVRDDRKFRFVPNMLSLTESLSENMLHSKQKRVVIVSRMEETSKRLSLALDIWKHVTSHPDSEGWTLDIVGSGPDEERYRRKVLAQAIPRVTFHGRQNPQPFYERSAIFMMTSRSEAWPLTLTESLQMGVVPVVFNSFCALHDVIKDKENGIIVADNAVSDYVDSVLLLMKNDDLRLQMALRGIADVERFSSLHVGEQWQSLIQER